MLERMEWRRALLDWYDAHRRVLPWRETADPYAIWVSEIMLQQTRVAAALPYYERWMRRFPTVDALAQSDEAEVLSAWQGLGYYRRARLLLEGARHVARHGWPNSREEWLNVPGVGPYTAAAIASIVLKEPAAAVDGNVERVYARFRGNPATGKELLEAARAWSGEAIVAERPGDWNQALMELGAAVCTPRGPKCPACPLESACVARQSWTVERFPTPSPRQEVVRRELLLWAPFHEGAFGLRQIEEGPWWRGMWEFPSVSAAEEGEWALRELVGPGWTEDLGVLRHQVTRHKLTYRASLVRCESRANALRWFAMPKLTELPLPSPQRRALDRAAALLGWK
jgi:A/G-specific adenine glycosylase